MRLLHTSLGSNSWSVSLTDAGLRAVRLKATRRELETWGGQMSLFLDGASVFLFLVKPRVVKPFPTTREMKVW
ncbi:MAG TPA: hypothetical protein DDY78_23455 [Planctomycetales bacterium]|nr:hypothetical protein [Planctomycetales bacterium]